MSREIDKIVSFMQTLNQFCLVERDNLLTNGQKERDSDHTFKLCFLVMALMPFLKKPIDALKVQQMALIHDITEAATKDFSYATTATDEEVRLLKKQAEEKAIFKYANSLPAPLGQQIFDLWYEYDARKTREAKLVYALDRMEATLQSNFNENGIAYWGAYKNGQFYYANAVKKHDYVKELKEPILDELEQAIIHFSKANIQKLIKQLKSVHTRS